jgi:hypothetical protein
LRGLPNWFSSTDESVFPDGWSRESNSQVALYVTSIQAVLPAGLLCAAREHPKFLAVRPHPAAGSWQLLLAARLFAL